MAMSPDEITGKTFQTRFRGLNPVEVKSHLEEVAGEFTALEEQIAHLEQSVNDQKNELQQAADDKKAFEDVADVFKDNIKKLKSELRVKEQNGQELLKELENLRDQAAELLKERDGLKGELLGKDTHISELESSNRMSAAAVDELRKKQMVFETEISTLKDQADEQERQLSAAREQQQEAAEQARHDSSRLVEAAREEIESLRTNASLEIVQLKDDIEALSARRSQVHHELRTILNNHLRRLDDLSSSGREREERAGDGYDELFQKIDFAELAEFDDDLSSGDGEGSHDPGAGGQDDAESEEQLKRKLEDGGIAYLSDV